MDGRVGRTSLRTLLPTLAVAQGSGGAGGTRATASLPPHTLLQLPSLTAMWRAAVLGAGGWTVLHVPLALALHQAETVAPLAEGWQPPTRGVERRGGLPAKPALPPLSPLEFALFSKLPPHVLHSEARARLGQGMRGW